MNGLSNINPRVVYATNMQNAILANSAAANNLICAVADECSMTDLQRIYFKFMNSLRAVQENKNITN